MGYQSAHGRPPHRRFGASRLHSCPFGAIFQHDFRGGFRQIQLHRTAEDQKLYDVLQLRIEMLPPTASVAATKAEAPHLSNREDLFASRGGVALWQRAADTRNDERGLKQLHLK